MLSNPIATPPKPTATNSPAKVNRQPVADRAPKPYQPLPRMVAEFEPQRAILLSVSDLQTHHGHVLKQIVEQSRDHSDILILHNNQQQLKSTVDLLNANSPEDYDHVSFHKLELDTVWLRDFGPRVSEDKSGIRSLDFYYYGVRPFDDSFPARWSLQTGGKMTKIPWTIQGGNLIANGKGIGITTSKIYEDNKVVLPGRTINEGNRFLVDQMKSFCNLKELIVLDPLRFESTKHVDMFAAFLAPDHVLIAELDPRNDRINSKILDNNARKMASLTVDGKPMRVSRIRIPKRDGNAWSTYTNAIFTDRLILVPTMDTDPPNVVRAAVKKYRQLMPNHHIATVDITSMKQLQGSLHCMTLNLPAIAPLPSGTLSFAQATKISGRLPKVKQPAQPANPTQRFTIDKQLRRIFKSSSSDFLLDAYAVALGNDDISLMRVNDRQLIRVRVSAVCEADRYWIQRNADKIRRNGARVRQYVLSQRSRAAK